MTLIAGLDVGGAHLKVAVLADGVPVAVEQVACPLWQGLDRLRAAFADVAPLIGGVEQVAVTMTGELSDLFASRAEGVVTLVDWLENHFAGTARASYFAAPGVLVDAAAARARPADIGSVNFLATALVAARHVHDSLLVDFGSTTADIMPLRTGRAVPQGLSDADRQATGELVYTGFTRTAVMAVASEAPFLGRRVGLAREYLATMADVRRILGFDLDAIDQHATADGRGKSVAESTVRLARMLGRDAAEGEAAAWRAVAAHVREMQLRSLHDAAALVATAHGLHAEAGAALVTAGIGATDAAIVADRLGWPSLAFGRLIEAPAPLQEAATHHAAAVAVALVGGGMVGR